MTVRTRFAPSPTGYLHIGGVRTALFNWLYAKQNGGQFVLRIDDTDEKRNVEAALQPILDGFRWLGIDWDEGPEVEGPHGPYYQSQRGEKYQAAARVLLDKGLAYRDYATSEELQAERQAAEKAKTDFQYSRRWMAETDAQAQQFEAEGRKAVVRLKMPREGTCRFFDHVRGDVEVAWSTEADHVIQRADGGCLYHLANVVDDHDMQISHVIRAIEHLSNTPRQIFIAEGLGYKLPEYVHLPYVAEPGSKKKLSKRDIEKYFKNRDFKKLFDEAEQIANRIGIEGDPSTFNPVLVNFYQSVGYLPEAILNYLLMLGWSLDDKTEHFTVPEMIEHFGFERIVKAPASFDPAKLTAFQQRHMHACPLKQKTEMALPFLIKAGLISQEPDQATRDYVQSIIQAAEDRIVVSGDVLKFDDFFIEDAELTYEAKAWEKRLVKDEEAADRLAAFRDVLAEAEPFEADHLQKVLHQFVEQQQIKIGQIIHALRVAVTGKAAGFGMFETLELLGRDRSLARIDKTLLEVASRT